MLATRRIPTSHPLLDVLPPPHPPLSFFGPRSAPIVLCTVTPLMFGRISPWCRSCVPPSWRRQTGGELLTAACSGCKTRWLHERERAWHKQEPTERERERIRRWAFCPSLHQLGIIRPTVAWYICPTCLLISSLSLFNVALLFFSFAALHPSRLAHFPLTLPYSMCTGVCVCVCALVPLCVRKRDHFGVRCLPK